MNRAMIALLISLTATVACSSRMQTGTTCQPYGNITIDLRPGEMKVSPKDRCGTAGEVIVLRIIPPEQPDGTVRTVADAGNPDGGGPRNWLSQPNRRNLILITVPDMDELREYCVNFPEEPCLFDYEVTADGKGEIDPRVTVRR